MGDSDAFNVAMETQNPIIASERSSKSWSRWRAVMLRAVPALMLALFVTGATREPQVQFQRYGHPFLRNICNGSRSSLAWPFNKRSASVVKTTFGFTTGFCVICMVPQEKSSSQSILMNFAATTHTHFARQRVVFIVYSLQRMAVNIVRFGVAMRTKSI